MSPTSARCRRTGPPRRRARAAQGDAFGSSVVVQGAHESARGTPPAVAAKQENTAGGYDHMVKSFESWAEYALPDVHPEHVLVIAMDAALKKFENMEAGFDHDVPLTPVCPTLC